MTEAPEDTPADAASTQPPPAEPVAIESAATMDDAMHALGVIAQRVDRLDDLFRRRLLDDRDKARAFDRLYEELETTREHRRLADQRAILLEVLHVVDRVERLIAGGEATPALDSVLAELRELLDRRRVTPIVAPDDRFDPRLQQAADRVEAERRDADGTVASVVRTGYLIGDAVLRPQQVVVRSFPRG